MGKDTKVIIYETINSIVLIGGLLDFHYLFRLYQFPLIPISSSFAIRIIFKWSYNSATISDLIFFGSA